METYPQTVSIGPPPGASPRGGLLVDDLLGEQNDLTAVERFAQFHGDAVEPLQGRFYSALLPGRAPRPGEQYAFEVDLDRCSGCKACVVACHAMNGLDEYEVWREVGLIVGGTAALPVFQHVTSACHHCLDPACLNACPVDAYEKDPVTGIVRHLDDQCFGCQYCTLACPYDVPKYHPGKGIVRKCDMCAGRLAEGEAPACVQACPHEAIRIRVVDKAEVVAVAEANGFLPSAPSAEYTLPTTRYLSRRPLQGAVRAADHHRVTPEHAHLPLALMLVMTQVAVGGFFADLAGRSLGWSVPLPLTFAALGLAVVGIHASLLHLGRPLYAYRALIGLRHSWLSREIAAFGLFAGAASAHAAAVLLRPALAGWTAAGASAAGALAVLCSVMVYHVVRRPFWRAGFGATKFAATAVVGGLALAFAATGGLRPLGVALAASAAAKLAFEAMVLLHLRDPKLTPLRKTAVLLTRALAGPSALRLTLGVLGGVLMPLTVGLLGLGAGAAWASVAVWLAGEFVERSLFFAAVVRPKMPGGLTS